MDEQYIPQYVNDYVLDDLNVSQTPYENVLDLNDNKNWNRAFSEENYPYIASPIETNFTRQAVLVNFPTYNPQLPVLPSRSTYVDDTTLCMNSRNQPLDLRPANFQPSGWETNYASNHHLKTESVFSFKSSESSNSNSDESTRTISRRSSEKRGKLKVEDKLLLTLTTKEFNSKFKCSPKNEILMLKKKRRTLKNRMYAKNCRKKRDEEKQILMEKNRELKVEIEKIKAEIKKVERERDILQLSLK